MIEILEITYDLRPKYNKDLIEFSKFFRYSYGIDTFYMDYGNNYFNFSDPIGKPYCFIALNEGKIIAVLNLVLRVADINGNNDHELIWYISDLKISPALVENFILQEFFNVAFEKCAYISKKIYGISLNFGIDKYKEIINLAAIIPNLNLEHLDSLAIFMLDFDQLLKVENILKNNFNNFSFISLDGIKNLILNSNNKKMPFVYFTNKEHLANPSITKLDTNYYYIITFPISHPIILEMRKKNIGYFITASLISNISGGNWSFIESSEL